MSLLLKRGGHVHVNGDSRTVPSPTGPNGGWQLCAGGLFEMLQGLTPAYSRGQTPTFNRNTPTVCTSSGVNGENYVNAAANFTTGVTDFNDPQIDILVGSFGDNDADLIRQGLETIGQCETAIASYYSQAIAIGIRLFLVGSCLCDGELWIPTPPRWSGNINDTQIAQVDAALQAQVATLNGITGVTAEYLDWRGDATVTATNMLALEVALNPQPPGSGGFVTVDNVHPKFTGNKMMSRVAMSHIILG
jgi:hypothetical protein